MNRFVPTSLPIIRFDIYGCVLADSRSVSSTDHRPFNNSICRSNKTKWHKSYIHSYNMKTNRSFSGQWGVSESSHVANMYTKLAVSLCGSAV